MQQPREAWWMARFPGLFFLDVPVNGLLFHLWKRFQSFLSASLEKRRLRLPDIVRNIFDFLRFLSEQKTIPDTSLKVAAIIIQMITQKTIFVMLILCQIQDASTEFALIMGKHKIDTFVPVRCSCFAVFQQTALLTRFRRSINGSSGIAGNGQRVSRQGKSPRQNRNEEHLK